MYDAFPLPASFGQSAPSDVDRSAAMNRRRRSAGKRCGIRKICRLDNEKMNEARRQAMAEAKDNPASGPGDPYIREREARWRMPGRARAHLECIPLPKSC